TSPFRWTYPLTYLPRSLREHRVARRIVKEISKRVSGYDGYFAIYNLPIDRIRYYDLCETSDIYRPGGLRPARSLFDILVERGIRYRCYNYHRYTDEQILKLAPEELADPTTSVYFLYLAGLDAYLHFHVKDEAGVTGKLRWYEEGLRRVYRAAVSSGRNPRFYLFSDHGMTPIGETWDVIRQVESLDLSVPEDYLPSYDSTMARFWFHSERAETAVKNLLASHPRGRWVERGEREELGIGFSDRRYGDAVFLMNPSVLIAPSDMGRMLFDGMHGFHPKEDPHAYAVFLSNRKPSSPVEHITHVLPALLEDLSERGLGVRGEELTHA
ncbi:MAG: alkaline phosphatase family protein, partial [Vicinamibacteria bacterium]